MPATFTTISMRPAVDGLLDHDRGLAGVDDAALVGFGRAPGLPDLGHHLLGRARVDPLAAQAGAQIVDDHPRPGLGHGDGDAPPRSRDQRILPVE
jgi:hypothetical protein